MPLFIESELGHISCYGFHYAALFEAVVKELPRAASRIEHTRNAKALAGYMHPLGFAGDLLLFPMSNKISSSIYRY